MKKYLTNTLSWLVTMLIPLALVGLGIRLLLNPVFLQIEYRMPAFPEDSYGFSLDDRLKWSKIAVEYLLNDAGITFLSDLRFEDGAPVYNERELGHMLDVKFLIQQVMTAWNAILLALLGLGLWARFGDWWPDYRRGLMRGGYLTTGLVGAIALLAVLSFNLFFVAFHRVFFEGDTWLFLYSDTLIRLFPVRFWQDCFIYIGAIALGGGLALGLGSRITHHAPRTTTIGVNEGV